MSSCLGVFSIPKWKYCIHMVFPFLSAVPVSVVIDLKASSVHSDGYQRTSEKTPTMDLCKQTKSYSQRSRAIQCGVSGGFRQLFPG